MAKETRAFQAEVKEILDLMIHSLYSQKEIFLRELVSNASDAIDKLQFESKKDPSLQAPHPEIRIEPDTEGKTLTISDNGIGMSYDEVLENIGTIARSGTREFIKKAHELKDHPELIGQFGVGFYSSFIVADKVTVHTQKAGTKEGVLWESTGDGSYTIDHVPKAGGNGTKITLHLKPEDKEDESFQDFTAEWVIKSTIKKYSDFIAHPIKMKVEKKGPKKDSDGKIIEGEFETQIVDETLNSQKALWLKSPSEIEAKEYNEFYKHISHDWSDPLKTVHYKAEGLQEFASLMYIPSQVPFDYGQRDMKFGLSLYVKRVFIMDHCQDVLPVYLRFVKGLVDSSDLSLNVSREILQQDRQVMQIKKAVTNKILSTLKDMLNKERELYEKFWEKFGATLKEGIASDYTNKEKIEDLALFHTTHSDKLTTLSEYVERMKEEQKEIYFLTGDELSLLRNSPYLEKLKKKDYEVLLLTDAVDEWVMNSLKTYKDKNVVSIASDNLDIETAEEKEKSQEELKEFEGQLKTLKQALQKALETNIKEVKLSSRLTETPVCLVSGEHDPSARMERLMSSLGQEMPKIKRILEINPKHPIIEKMKDFSEEEQKSWGEILYNQALLNEGSPIQDPVKFSQQITQLMMKS